MKRAENLVGRVADPDNLRLAVWKAAKGKRYSREVRRFAETLNANLLRLREQIQSGEVAVGNYRYFKVYEPKERNICAPAFDEQVLHHALMNVCHPLFEQKQIFDSYASRKNKGTYAALDRAKSNTRRYCWYLKLDVRKFFESIHHEVLCQQLAAMFKDEHLRYLFDQIIAAYQAQPMRGLPIGNLTSQYFANHYLTGLDHFIKEKLRVRAYVRYMDDMVLWHDQKCALQKAEVEIRNFVDTQLRCELKPEALNRSAGGLPFLGYHVFPHHVRLLQKSKQRFLKKMKIVDAHFHAGVWSEARCQRCAMSLLAFIRHADAKKLQENLFLPLKGQSS